MQINISNQVNSGEGLPPAIEAAAQATAFLAGEAVRTLMPRFRQLPLEQKVGINLAVVIIPSVIGTVISTVVAHKLDMQRTTRR